MKLFWWTEGGELYVAERGEGFWNYSPYYRDVRDLLEQGYVEISFRTAYARGWPA